MGSSKMNIGFVIIALSGEGGGIRRVPAVVPTGAEKG
jgi:hypothetical protein